MKAAIFKDPFKPIKMEYHKGFDHLSWLSLAMSTSRGYGSSHESLPTWQILNQRISNSNSNS